jgi:uncharacterized protein GlcG (DUF336 family)
MMRIALIAVAATTTGLAEVSFADDEVFSEFRVLKPEIALAAAQGAISDCRVRGYQVAVSVVDRFGILQVTLRDQFAGSHTPDTSFRKAWTAASFRTNTHDLAEAAASGEMWGLRNITMALPLGGGVTIVAGDGDTVGAIGVSGAPSGTEDAVCANAGIEAIADRIAF